mgnify:CR=1 FL=1
MSKGIKRHPCLQPLSRDHLIALMGAQRLIKASTGEITLEEGLEYFLRIFKEEVNQHLIDEEAILPEFIKDKKDLERLLSDHKKLRSYVEKLKVDNQNKTLFSEAGNFLDAHVRWEEREFFPRIEKTSTKEEIEKLLELTDQVEKKRSRNKSCQTRKKAKKNNAPG